MLVAQWLCFRAQIFCILMWFCCKLCINGQFVFLISIVLLSEKYLIISVLSLVSCTQWLCHRYINIIGVLEGNGCLWLKSIAVVATSINWGLQGDVIARLKALY